MELNNIMGSPFPYTLLRGSLGYEETIQYWHREGLYGAVGDVQVRSCCCAQLTLSR